MRYRVLPYRQGSKSAKALAEALGGRVIRLSGTTFVPRHDDVIINWGNGDDLNITKLACIGVVEPLNKDTRSVTDKLAFFNLMKDKQPELIPEFFTNKDDINDSDFPIVCRTILSGHSGAGIVIADNRDGLVDAPLFVRYVKKKDEYRIHVGRKGDDVSVISVQRKAKRNDTEVIDWRVRNLANGFVFVRQGVTPPSAVEQAACDCLRATGLDFGAVDVIWNAAQEKAYVLEINTAPGLEGQTVLDYAKFFTGSGVNPVVADVSTESI